MLYGDGPHHRSSAEMTASAEHLKPLAKATLPQEIVAAIAHLIMTRIWKPGDRIPPEKELTSRFGVGRSSLREAIQSLVILGVIEARPGDGSYIRAGTSDLLSGAFEWGLMLGEQNLDDLVAMRMLIEGECAGRAAAARDADLAPALFRLVDEMKDAVGQPQLFMKLDNRFHEMIAAGARNALYLSLSKTIRETRPSLVRADLPARAYKIGDSRRASRDCDSDRVGFLTAGAKGNEGTHPTRWGAIAQKILDKRA